MDHALLRKNYKIVRLYQYMPKSISNKYHIEILTELKKHANRATKSQRERERKYIGTKKFCCTVSVPLRRKIAKEWIRKNPKLSFSEFLGLLNSLHQGKSHDEISFAGKLLEQLPNFRKKLNPEILNDWLNRVKGWAEVDSICQSKFSAKEFLENWQAWKKLLQKLAKDKNPHKKRASLVLLTTPVRESSDLKLAKLAFENIDGLKTEKDILVTKAISWLLRDLIKNHRKLVKFYLKENSDTLPKIAIRETKNKLSTGKK